MNTYVTVQQENTQEHFQVSLHFSEDQLRLFRSRGFRRPKPSTNRNQAFIYQRINGQPDRQLLLSGSPLYILSIWPCRY